MATARPAGPASGTGGDLGAGGDVGGHRPGISSAPPTQATAASDEAAARIARLRASPLRAVLGEVGARVLRPGTLLPLGSCVIKAVLAHLAAGHDERVSEMFMAGAIASAVQAAAHAVAYGGDAAPPWVDTGDGLRAVAAAAPPVVDLAGIGLLADGTWAMSGPGMAGTASEMSLAEGARAMNLVNLGIDLLASATQLIHRLREYRAADPPPAQAPALSARRAQPARPTAPYPGRQEQEQSPAASQSQSSLGEDPASPTQVVMHTVRRESKYETKGSS